MPYDGGKYRGGGRSALPLAILAGTVVFVAAVLVHSRTGGSGDTGGVYTERPEEAALAGEMPSRVEDTRPVADRPVPARIPSPRSPDDGTEVDEEEEEPLESVFSGGDPRRVIGTYFTRDTESTLILAGRAFDEETGELLSGIGFEIVEAAQAAPAWLAPPIGGPVRIETDSEGLFRREVTMRGRGRPSDVWLALDFEENRDGYVYTGPGELGRARASSSHLRRGAAWFDLPFRRGAPLRGRVVGPDGRTPAPGTRVAAVAEPPEDFSARHSSNGPPSAPQRSQGFAPPHTGREVEGVRDLFRHPGQHDAHFTATSGSGGRFELLLPPGSSGTLHAQGPKGSEWTGFAMPDQGAHPEMVIILSASGSVEGRVLHPDGRGAPGARVTLKPNPEAFDGVMGPVTAGEDGVFAFVDVPPGPVVLEFEPPGGDDGPPYAGEPVEFELGPGEDRRDVELHLHPGNSVSILVLAEDTEEPVPDAEVRLHSFFRTPPGAPERSSEVRNATTDQNGRCVIDGMHPSEGGRFFGVYHPQYQTSRPRQRDDGIEEELVVHLTPLAERELIARWEEDGSPVRHYSYTIKMWLSGSNRFAVDGGIGSRTVRSADGRTVMEGLRNGTRHVEVTALDESGEPTGAFGMTEFTVQWSPDAADEPVEVLVSRGGRIEGEVRHLETGAAVPGATVEISPPIRGHEQLLPEEEQPGRDARLIRVRTDSAGRFEAPGLAPGTYALRASRGFDITHDPVRIDVETASSPEPIQLEIAPANTIHGRVTNHEGEPLAGFEVRHQGYPLANWERPRTASGAPRHVHKTDEAGHYRIEGVMEGFHIVGAHGAFTNRDYRQSFSFRNEYGRTREVNIQYDGRIDVAGSVQTGSEVAGDTLTLWFEPHAGGDAVYVTLPVDERRYEAKLSPGSYTVNAAAPGHRLEVEPPSMTVEPRPPEQAQDLAVQPSPRQREARD